MMVTYIYIYLRTNPLILVLFDPFQAVVEADPLVKGEIAAQNEVYLPPFHDTTAHDTTQSHIHISISIRFNFVLFVLQQSRVRSYPHVAVIHGLNLDELAILLDVEHGQF